MTDRTPLVSVVTATRNRLTWLARALHSIRAQSLTDYQRAPAGKDAFLHFTFCQHCGFRPFTRGGYLPAFGGTFHAVNIACLDGLSDEERAAIPVRYADGQHDDWEGTPAVTGHL